MARLESQKNMGYYPTPVSIVDDIKQLLNCPDKFRVLDTCCGNGDAIECIRRDTGAETYGIELHKERAAEAKKKLNFVLNCDALHEVAITNNAFDVLFINPPYDWTVKGDENSNRFELSFLEYHKKYLNPAGGILIYVVPITSIKYIYRHFLKLKDLQIFSFPDGEYERYNQVVLIGQSTLSVSPMTLDDNRDFLETVMQYAEEKTERCPFLLTTKEATVHGLKYHVKQCSAEVRNFRSTRFTPDEAYEIVQNSQLYKDFNLVTKVEAVSALDHLNPLMMPKQGHIGMLIAAGYANGVLNHNGKRLLIKGVIDADRVLVKDDDEEKHNVITTETQYKIVINAIDLVDYKLLVIKN